MKAFFYHLQKLDWGIGGAAVLLSLLGLLSLYSSSLGLQDFGNFQKQIIFLAAGIVLMLGISFFDYRLLRNDPYFLVFLWGIGVVALAGLFVFAPEIRGIKGWYKVGAISIDPIEYIKIVLVVLMAKFFSMRHIEMYRVKHIILSGIYFALPAALIFLQPDLGAASLLAFLWIIILLVSGIKLRHFLAIVLIGVLVFALGWSFMLQDYQRNRIISFLEPELDPLGIGWSQLQSRIAIGNGGLLGQGIGNGTQTQYGFLSEPQTDFIFAAIAEELGFVGVVVLIGIFGFLLYKMFKVGIQSRNNFPRLFVTGFAGILIIQFFINIGMNLGLLPIIGLPLPFVSYGGSSMLAMYAGLGILQSIRAHS